MQKADGCRRPRRLGGITIAPVDANVQRSAGASQNAAPAPTPPIPPMSPFL
jgi:hypothetical protein